MIKTSLTNPYTVAVLIPTILLLSGAFAKKLVRGSSWEQKDFFFGVEFTLAAMSSALVYIFDLSKDLSKNSVTATGTATLIPVKLTVTAAFIAVTFFLLLWVLSTHQDWEKPTADKKKQFWRLCVLANLIGGGLMAAFILVVKGVE